MKTLIFGSCRVKRFRAHLKDQSKKKSFSICQHHLHNPHEILQLLNWINGGDFSDAVTYGYLHNEIETRVKNTPSDYYTNLAETYRNSDRIIIELSSIKRLLYKDAQTCIDCNLTSFAHLRKIEDPKISSIVETITKPDEFLAVIKNINEIVKDKELIIIPHYSWSDNGQSLKSRETLRGYIKNSCNNLNLKILDPDIYIKKFQERSSVCIDSSHYTEKFEKLIARFVSKNL